MLKGCHHTMPTGRRCQAIPLRGMAYCYYHQKLHKALNASKHAHRCLQLPSIQSRTGIQDAMETVISALGKARIDQREATVFMYGLGIAAQLVPKPSELDTSRTLPEEGPDHN